mgnify:CR=1 FL=1
MPQKAKLNVFQELFFNYICMVLNYCESNKLIQLCFQPFLFCILPKGDMWMDVIDLFTWRERETDRKKNMQVGGLISSFVNGFIFNSIWKAYIMLCVCVTISSSTCSLSAVSQCTIRFQEKSKHTIHRFDNCTHLCIKKNDHLCTGKDVNVLSCVIFILPILPPQLSYLILCTKNLTNTDV